MSNPIIRQDISEVIARPLDWSGLSGKSVLVTGAAGFIAAYLVEVLLALNKSLGLGIHVVALVRNEQRARLRFKDHAGSPGFELLVQDVCAPLRYERKVDIVIHAASQASPKFYRVDPVGTLRPNIVGTDLLLQFAHEQAVSHFLFFSSAEVYGDASQDTGIDEKFLGRLDQTNIRSCYAESKRVAETMCVSWHAQHGLPVQIVRPFHTYGPGLDLEDGRIFADIIASVVRGNDIQLTSDGSAVRAYCYIADAVAAYFYILLRGAFGEAYNVGNEEQTASVSELVTRVQAAFPERAIGVRRLAPKHEYYASSVNSIIPDTRKLRHLGWNPSVGIEDGFRRSVLSHSP